MSYTPTLEDQLADALAEEISKEIDTGVIIAMLANWPNDVYFGGTVTLPYGWAGELTYSNVTNFQDHMSMYYDMVQHINKYVKNPKQNCMWNKIGDCVYVMFRKQKDMQWFVLKYGA